MSIPIWAASPLRACSATSVVSLLEIVLTDNHLLVKDSEIGQVYLDAYVYVPDMFSLKVSFNANGVKSIEVVKE